MAEILVNNRETFIDFLKTNYTYENLLKIFNPINLCNLKSLVPIENKFLYRIMTGTFTNSKYRNSVINWIPSREFISSLINLADYFKVDLLQEINAGLGVFSSLFKIECTLLNKNIKIITSDSFTDSQTCKQLGFTTLVRKEINDFKYYNQLNINYPSMLIFSYYPHFESVDNDKNCINDLFDLLHSKNHKIIVFVAPIVFSAVYSIINNFALGDYTYVPVPIKVISKHDEIFNYSNINHRYSTIAHIFVKKESHELISKKTLYEIIDPMIVKYNNEIPYIDTWPSKLFNIYKLYFCMSDPLLNDIYKLMFNINYNNENSDFKLLMKKISSCLLKLKCIPLFIETVNELKFWLLYFEKNFIFYFDSRNKFLDFFNIICDSKKLTSYIPSTIIESIIGSEDLCIYCVYLLFMYDIQQTRNSTNTTITSNWYANISEFKNNLKNLNLINEALIYSYSL